MKKSLVLALVAVLVLSFASMAFAFTDTTSHWAKDYIAKLVDLKVVNGTTATTFVPDGKVTRAEFAKMIVNAKGLALENPATATFSDVATTAWYFPYVEAAAKAKYIDGVGDGKFAPMALVTREQVAKMVVLAAGKTADTTKALNFDDKASISDWAKGFVAVAADLKLIEGYNNKFNAKNNATRAEAAKLVYGEMKYEGKITEEVVVGTDQITDFKLDTEEIEYPLVAITIGGKRYDVDPKVDITLGGKEVNGYAVRKNTHAKFTLDKDDVVTNLELSTTDYTVKTGKVEAKGQAGATAYVVIAGTKVSYDVEADNYVTINSDVEKITAAEPSVGTSYMLLVDEAGKGYYWAKVDDAAVKGNVDYVGKDTKVYVFVNGKKYYADATSTTADYQTDKTWASLAGQYVEFSLDGNDYIDADSVSTDMVYSGYVADKPFLVGNDTNGYDVYVKVVQEATNNKYTSGSYFWVHYGSELDFISKDDVPDHAVKVANAAAAGVDEEEDSIVALEKYAGIYIDGKSKDLSFVAKRGYVLLKYKEAGKINSADFYAASAKGRVEKITKDGSDKVTKVTISGKEYTYTGQTTAHTTTDEGKMWVAANNALAVIAVDDLVDGVVTPDGNLVTLIKQYTTNLENEATVTAIGGGKSVMTKNNSDADPLYVPANTIEVKYTSGGVSKIAWLTYAWKDTDNDRSYDDKEEGISLVVKGDAGVAFSTIKVGDVVDFVTADGSLVTGKEYGLMKYLYTPEGSSLTDSDYDYPVASATVTGAAYYAVDALMTNADTFTGTAPFTFNSYPATFINVR